MKKILIVEDQDDIREVIRITLELEDYELHEADNGDGGYAAKVMSERNFLTSYLGGSNPQDNNAIESADSNKTQQIQSQQGLLKFLGVNLTDS